MQDVDILAGGQRGDRDRHLADGGHYHMAVQCTSLHQLSHPWSLFPMS